MSRPAPVTIGIGAGTSGQPADSARKPIPGDRGTAVLWFVAIALIEYWTAPAFLGVGDTVATWATLGWILLACLAGSIIVVGVVPLLPRLRSAVRRRPRARAELLLGTSGGFLSAWLLSAGLPIGGAPGAAGASATTVYTPFGPFPSLGLQLPGYALRLTLNVELALVLGLIAFLAAGAFVLSRDPAVATCPSSGDPSQRPRRAGEAWAYLSPLGLVSGCSACTPAYLAVLGALLPGATASGYSDLPVTPWIGLTGLVYLASLGLVLRALRRTTRATATEVGAARAPDGG